MDNHIRIQKPDISRLLELSHRVTNTEIQHLILHYTHGLKAMLDILPDNTDDFSTDTIEHYLWVIEHQLHGILHHIDEHLNAKQP